jgi:ATPase subunit of ABC transporter with duplicated ATPase domains
MSKTSIEISGLTKRFGGSLLFDGISFTLPPGSKTGLVGLNGCGKSTLLKIIAGLESPDEGRVKVIGPGPAGYLPQDADFGEDTLQDVLMQAFGPVSPLEEWEKGVLAKRALEEAGLHALPLDFPSRQLSGGEKTRLGIARLLVCNPGFILLDEPTNFLDIAGLEWMEKFVAGLPQGVLMVSHDRRFLDRTARRILEIEKESIQEYGGNYSFFREQKLIRQDRQWKEFKSLAQEEKRLKALIRREKLTQARIDNSTVNDFVRSRAKGHSRRAKALEKRLERMEKVDRPRKDYMADISFKGQAVSRVVARVEGLSKSFGDRLLYRDVEFTIQAGERVGIVGENGSGKTTLLNMLMGREEPSQGRVFFLPPHRVGCFSQVFDGMGEKCRAIDYFCNCAGMVPGEGRQFLASFLFLGDSVFKAVGSLSTGERSRLTLACVKAQNPEVLVLDEPTNHLDVGTTEILEEALIDFPGTVIIVTHDRFLLDRLADRLLVIDEARIREYQGNYAYYEEKRMEEQPGRA